MTLTGVDPNDPIPSVKRELIFGAGPGSSGIERDVVLFGNKTASGVETVDVLGTPIADDLDARDRFGERSELYAMYRAFVSVDTSATIYGIAVDEATGTAAEVDIDVVGVSDFDSTVSITILGQTLTYQVSNGDAIATTAAGIAAVINAADEGRLPVSAVAALGVCTVTYAHEGTRGDFVIGTSATQGLRVSIATKGGTNTQTVVKNAVPTAGAGEDDGTDAIAAVADKDSIYWIVAPWHTVTTSPTDADARGTALDLSATDNQIGELVDMVKTQNMPANSKEKQVVLGHVSTPDNSIQITENTLINSTRASMFNSYNSDWTPAMLAAHHCAIMRSGYIGHPSRNRAGYTQSDNTPYKLPALNVSTDVPSATELRTMLNGGVSPVSYAAGDRPVCVRPITSRNTNDGGAKDYKAREHHITYAVDFVWSEVKARWNAQKQEFVAANPKEGELGYLNTTTPRDLRGMIFSVLDTMTSNKPMGRYNGPILAPDHLQHMKDSVVVDKVPAGLSVVAEFICVQHLLKFEGKFLETGEAY